MSSFGVFNVESCKQIMYLKRQTVCAKPSGTGPVPSAASWCSPCGWHSENCPHTHPGNETLTLCSCDTQKQCSTEIILDFNTHL